MSSRNSNCTALTGYPLSSSFRKCLEEMIGFTPDYLSVVDLRWKSIRGLLRILWSRLGETLLIPLEDVNSVALLPVLETLSSASDARRIEVVHPDLRRESVSRLMAIFHFGRMIGASIASRRSANRCRYVLEELLCAPRIDISLHDTTGDVLYLKTNLWFGVKVRGPVIGKCQINGLCFGTEIIHLAYLPIQ